MVLYGIIEPPNGSSLRTNNTLRIVSSKKTSLSEPTAISSKRVEAAHDARGASQMVTEFRMSGSQRSDSWMAEQ
jgi:hypothetical protein